ncbi:neutrophil cytosol factor 2-like [Stegostoma tigrinum]|uniref:neutrophil cytosol factor 2-like n=1 Tax=Stegostoma tigrinum TaxID=3053191 RepID=UPI00286FE46D|nr:neutrophil cytosol factor 2-like [Stegostoma tigrinum]
MFDEALGDFKHALNNLRSNSVIDYSQLGLRHRLYTWEVLYNLAAVQSRLDQWLEAQQTLEDALRLRAKGTNTELDRALSMVKSSKTFEPIDVPEGIVFRPRKHEVDELNLKDFLGTPKVVSSIDPNDSFAGFKPLCPPKLGEQVVRGTRGYHQVLFNFAPKTASEIEAKAGSIVFVMENGEDGWSTVIADNKKGLIPTTYLEVWARNRRNKLKQGSGNVSQTPPHVPASRQTETEGETHSKTLSSSAGSWKDCSLADSVIIKVHYEYTLATRMKPGISYSEFVNVFKSKLGRRSGQIQLSYKEKEKQELVEIRGDEDLNKVWNQIVDRRLTLWCKCKDPLSGRKVLYQTQALYDYNGHGAEDVEFNEGDIIDVLSEVNEEWLEGHSNGNIGIFPRCFVRPRGSAMAETRKIDHSEDSVHTQAVK